MTRADSALERLRSSNPMPSDHVDTDELGRFLAHFEGRRVAMSDTKTIHRKETQARKPRRFTPVLVFVTSLFAVLIAIGVTALFLQGEEEPTSPAASLEEAPEPTISEEPAVLAEEPDAATAEVTTVLLSNEPEYLATVTIGPEGLPIIASQQVDPDTYFGPLRLLSCADPGCEETEVVELADLPWIGRELEPAISPDGNVYLIIGGPDGDNVMLFEDGEPTTLPAMFNWPYGDPYPYPILPSAFLDDGRPVFVGPIDTTLSLVVCDDPACTSRIEVPLADGEFLHYPGALIDGDRILIPYSVGELAGPLDPEGGPDGVDKIFTTSVAAVIGIDGTPVVTAEVVSEGLNEILVNSVLVDDSLIMWFFSWREQETQGDALVSYSTLTCQGTDCTLEPSPALGGWAWPYDTVTPNTRLVNAVVYDVYDPAEYQAYLDEEARISEEGLDQGAEVPVALGTHIAVIECTDTACSRVERHTVAVQESWWYLDSIDTAVAADGTTYVLAGSSGEDGSDPGLTLYAFPPGTLGDLAEPIEGMEAIR